MRTDLPEGSVTFLFGDIEGSTRLLRRLGEAPYAEALAVHRRVLRDAFARHGGVEIDTQGDAFFYVFATPMAPWTPRARATMSSRRGPVDTEAARQGRAMDLTEAAELASEAMPASSATGG